MTNRDAAQRNTGISNRESAREESAERRHILRSICRLPHRGSTRACRRHTEGRPGGRLANVAQERKPSTAQNQADSRHRRALPASASAGVFGKEPDDSSGTAPE